MVLASCERGKRGPRGFATFPILFEAPPQSQAQADIAIGRAERLGPPQEMRRAARRYSLFGIQFSLDPDFVGTIRIVCNFHGHTPNQSLNPARAGVIFAAIEERKLRAKLRLASFMTSQRNA
jgi:hypothetical protein